MLSTSEPKPHVDLIDHMAAEWRSIGRTRAAVEAIRKVAGRDEAMGLLVLGSGDGPGPCPTPVHVLASMHRVRGRAKREAAAHLVRVLLREVDTDPIIGRMLVEALVPGLITVAGKLKWGQDGDWLDGEEFFGEIVGTTWLVIREWAGQDRPYAVLDLLSAIRCRMRRQLFRARDEKARLTRLSPEGADRQPGRIESDLERAARVLIEARRDGMHAEEAQILYAHHVLGYSLAELAESSGRDRRTLYSRRERGRRRLYA
jgi:hypothetical protein